MDDIDFCQSEHTLPSRTVVKCYRRAGHRDVHRGESAAGVTYTWYDDNTAFMPASPATVETELAATSKPERQIIHELCLILATFHGFGSERGAADALPEWLVDRYRWACVQAADDGWDGTRHHGTAL